MYDSVVIARLFLESFDGSSVNLFRRFLNRNSGVSKWMIGADFALHNPDRPMETMAFTIMPYDAHLDPIAADIAASVPKDLKKTKELSSDSIAWFRDSRRFHVVISMHPQRTIFGDGVSDDEKLFAREHIEKSIEALQHQPDKERLKRFKKLQQEANAKGFNVELLANI